MTVLLQYTKKKRCLEPWTFWNMFRPKSWPTYEGFLERLFWHIVAEAIPIAPRWRVPEENYSLFRECN